MSQPPDQRYRLEPETELALGRVSPQLAWEQVKTLAAQSVQEYTQASLEAARRLNWAPERDLRDLMEALEDYNPVRGINLLRQSNPQLSLRELPEVPPLKMLEAVIHTLLTNDRLLAAKDRRAST